MLTAFDLLLIAIAIVIMVAGFRKRWAAVQLGRPEKLSRDPLGLIQYLLGHGKILQNRKAGWAHLCVFFGFLIPLVVIILSQFDFVMPVPVARLLSLLTDLLGLAMLVGLVYFLLRRFGVAEPRAPQRTIFPVMALLFIIVTGFLAEGTRLAIVPAGFSWSSPVGWLISLTLPNSPLLMQVLIRLHFFALLVFVAALPFTFMRHLVASSQNVYYKRQAMRGAARPVSLEADSIGARTIKDFTWKQLLESEACVSCGRCEENCPASLAEKPLSPRKVIQDILSQMEHNGRKGSGAQTDDLPLLAEAITADEIWSCTTCMACVTHCPVLIEPLDKIIDMRRYLVMGEARLPAEARPMIRDLEIYGDVQGKGVAHRADWAMNREVPQLFQPSAQTDSDLEMLLWVGCSGAFHPRNQETSRAMVKILKAAGIRFAILGKEELCCGDPARRLGDEILFQKLARANIDHFNRHQVKKIVTLCPHCLNTLKNEYPELGCKLEVVHATELVMDLIRKNRIALKYPVADKMTIHDACYLGRYNQVYQPPRDISIAVPGTQLKETERNRDSGYCCGGGGGRMWLHENIGQKINVVRAEEMVKTGIDLIGTACPYCLVMLDDGVKSLELEKPPKVADIIDIVAESLG
ncbi:MAG: (Fe-S)-binding protein [Desulfobacterales bacterium]